jgi:hypothetical protein
LLVLAAGAIWLTLRRPVSDRELIDGLIDQVEQGVETKNLGKIMSAISKDYSDSLGLSRRQIFRMALDFVRSEERCDVLVDSVSIELHPSRVHGPSAKASMHVLVTELSAESATAEPATIYDGPVEVELRKEGRSWRVISSGGWQSAAPEEYL